MLSRTAVMVFLMLSLISTTAFSRTKEHALIMPVEEEVRVLIGIEYSPGIQGEKFTSRLSCTRSGGGLLYLNGVFNDEWVAGTGTCQGRTIKTLERMVKEENGLSTWRIVDALLLPPVADEWDPNRQNKLQISLMGECTFDGQTNTSFFALVRWRDREPVDWKTGVEHAWTYDIEQGRIVPVSTKRIMCEWLEP